MAPKPSPKNLLGANYNPVDNIKKASHISLSADAIRINMNNWMAKLSTNHTAVYVNTFFLSSALYGALTLNPSKMYHEYLCEFWYTAVYVESDESIHYTLKQGTKHYTITVDSLRDALRMNYFDENEIPIQIPSGINTREVCRLMGHT